MGRNAPKGTGGRLTNVGICQVGDPARQTSINAHWLAFVEHLRAKGVAVTVRDTRGREIDGACGQLAATEA